MKKKLLSVITLSAILGVGVVSLAGCDERTTQQTQKYSVTCETSSDYTVSGLNAEGYSEGDLVSFTVTVTNEEKEIESVKVNGRDIQGSGSTYQFGMPAQDVTIVITLKNKGSEVPPVDYKLTFGSSLKTEMLVGDTQTVSVYFNGSIRPDGYTLTTEQTNLLKIEGNTITALAEGVATLNAAYTYESKEYTVSAEISITDLFGGVALAKFEKSNMTNLTSNITGNATYLTKDGVSDSVSGVTLKYTNNLVGVPNSQYEDNKPYIELGVFQLKSNSNATVSEVSLETNEVLKVNKVIITYVTSWSAGITDPLRVNVGNTSNSSPIFSTGESTGLMDGSFEYKIYKGAYVFDDAVGRIEIENTVRAAYIQSIEIFGEASNEIDATSISFNSTDKVVTAGESTRLNATLNPSNSSNKITYEITSGSEFATIRGKYLIGVQEGEVDVVAKATKSDGTVLTSEAVTFTIEPAKVDITPLSEVKKLNDDTEFVSRAYYMGRNSSPYTKNETSLYNGVYVADGDETYLLYSVEESMIASIEDQLVIGETIIEFAAKVADYNGLKECGSVEYIHIVDEDETIKKPTILNISKDTDITLGEENISRRVSVSDALVTNITTVEDNDNYEYKDTKYRTNTYTLEVGSHEYELQLDERYDNFTSEINEITVGDTISFESFVYKYGTGNSTEYYFYYIDNLEVVNGQEIAPTKITISADKTTISVNQTATLSYALEPNGASSEVTYEVTSGEDVVSISGNVVTGLKVGEATIVGKVNGLTSDPITITVKEAGETTLVKTGKLGLYQENLGQVLYFNGEISGGRFLATTTDFDSAEEIDVLQNDNGYLLRLEDGTYIGANFNNEKANFELTSEECYWNFDSENNAFTKVLDGDDAYFIGTYSDFNTFSLSGTWFMESGNFIANVYEEDINVLPSEVTLNAEKTTLKINEYTQLEWTTTPEESTLTVKPSFTSDNEEVATVSGTGLVTGISQGTANITITYGNVKDTIAISVTNEEIVINSVNYVYTPDFNNGTLSGSAYSTGGSLTVSNALEAINNTTEEISTYLIDKVTNVENVYRGRESGANGLKFGAKEKAGTLEFTTTQNVKSLTLSVIAWKGDNATFTVNGISQKINTSDGKTIETIIIEFDEATKTFEIISGTNTSRFAIVGMSFELA
ncbi:MAG: Ig-like domain-containing protein [Firmicutes bacterium]|uniref:Ig-like domain-containing protein n=1 Tax=Candidatus Onthovivens merdipullorum TaxID=2840889 RepID=A0A9D9DM20_9BACL|nr:Ig-like domain-containing protein [Candidatus Onthovivens merdipullorum]